MQNFPENARIKFWNIYAHNFHQAVINYAIPTSRIQAHLPKSVSPSIFSLKDKSFSILSFTTIHISNFITGSGIIKTGSSIDFSMYYINILNKDAQPGNFYLLAIQSNSLSYLFHSYLKQLPLFYTQFKTGNMVRGMKVQHVKISGKCPQLDFEIDIDDIGEKINKNDFPLADMQPSLFSPIESGQIFYTSEYSNSLKRLDFQAKEFNITKGVVNKISIEAFRNLGLLTKQEEHQPFNALIVAV